MSLRIMIRTIIAFSKLLSSFYPWEHWYLSEQWMIRFQKLLSSFYPSDWFSPSHWCCVPQQGDNHQYSYWLNLFLFSFLFGDKTNTMIRMSTASAQQTRAGWPQVKSIINQPNHKHVTYIDLEANMEHPTPRIALSVGSSVRRKVPHLVC